MYCCIMNIKEVKTAVKIENFVLKKNGRNKIDIEYLPNRFRKSLYFCG